MTGTKEVQPSSTVTATYMYSVYPGELSNYNSNIGVKLKHKHHMS